MMRSDTPEPRDFDAAEALEGAIAWWREAGVDFDYADAPTQWLAEPEADHAVAAPQGAVPPPPPPATPLTRALEQEAAPLIGGALTDWPTNLEKFREWWMTEPSLAEGSLDRRVPPRGVAGAKLCILVPQPEPDDGEGLLTGGAGRLLSAMLQSMEVSADEVYLASVLPAPMPLPDWSVLARRGLAEVTRHHLALAAPARVLAIGRSPLALFDIAPDKLREPLTIEVGEKPLPLLAAPDFSQIARSAKRRETLWHRWLEWTT
ncbi:hypothetical protein P8Q88_04520 [Qipengyuania sp. XHP0207]|uniref:hypothetical protein n=1 Tax=Qipengyuania sp. XHP0207 TaxID=3038078 RepID=UPI00241FFC11|nr:hypothetical protein [Qipengyuania sp. XHP0207]MDG5747436.1 hypothetical protein [Qipengyuania sp. XHP0207]